MSIGFGSCIIREQMVPPPNVCSQSMRTRDCLEGDAVKFPLVPDFYFESIHAIDLARLRARGVRLLLADLDNTLVPYGVHTPTQPVRAWKQGAGPGGDHPVSALQQPQARPGPAIRGGSGYPL